MQVLITEDGPLLGTVQVDPSTGDRFIMSGERGRPVFVPREDVEEALTLTQARARGLVEV